MPRNRKRSLVPGASANLEAMKYEVAQELSYFPNSLANSAQYEQHLDGLKYEIAQELGIPLNPGYNGEITSRQAGQIGGRIGGRIGGQMVKRMIQQAQQNMQQ